VHKIKSAIISLEESLLLDSRRPLQGYREKHSLLVRACALVPAQLLENSELIVSLVQAVDGDAEPALWTVDGLFIRSVMVDPKKSSQMDVIITDDGKSSTYCDFLKIRHPCCPTLRRRIQP
jgi:hypothetical protein